MSITVRSFGCLPDGREAMLYTITNGQGASVSLTNYGASVMAILVPDQEGKLRDVALGSDSVEVLASQGGCLGAVPGRHANRIGKGRFVLNGKEYQLSCNNGENHLHGGPGGFHKQLWSGSVQGDKVVFSRLSPDGEEGYPGNLLASVAYSLDEENQLLMEYHALCDQDTVLNLTNHAYFNLNGHDSGDIYSQELKLYSQRFTENDKGCLTTGRILPVEGTAMDFREWKAFGKEINGDDVNVRNVGGYDHNFVLEQEGDFALCAEAYSPDSGIHMSVYSTQPGVQLYTGNSMAGMKGKGGVSYIKHGAFCLETQHWPNATSYEHFPSVILRAGEHYEHMTAYAFSVGK